MTKLVAMVSEISRHLDLDHSVGEGVEKLKRNVAPEAVLDAIDQSEK